MRKRLIDIEELSEMLSVKKPTIYWWVRGNQIPHVKLGRLVRFDIEKVEDWLQKREVRPRKTLTYP